MCGRALGLSVRASCILSPRGMIRKFLMSLCTLTMCILREQNDLIANSFWLLCLFSFQETDGNKVVRNLIERPSTKTYRFCKHMAKHRTPGLSNDLMTTGKHVLLIRDPVSSLPSFDKVLPVTLDELELANLVGMYSELSARGNPPPIVNARDLQQNPEGILRALCEALKIPFQASMLRWPAGPKPEDGLWAPWWYKTVHKTTEFNARSPFNTKPFPKKLYHLLEHCQPFYNLLNRHALRPASTETIPPPLPVSANEKLLIWVNDQLLVREDAKVSVFDSIVQGGDGVWEGLRIYRGKIFKLEEHLDRMFDSAKAMAFKNVPSRTEVKNAIFSTLIANDMRDCAHVRLTLTRGKKFSSGMSPAFNVYGCNLLVVAEWKPPVYDNTSGIRLITASTRRNSPNSLDSKIHHNNLINNILAKVEGNLAGADDAIMLDCEGFVSETNATNIFMVKKGCISTPLADYCLPGITRATVIGLIKEAKMPFMERRISLTEFHAADEVWTTGTMGELSPVVEIDGRVIGDGKVGPITKQLQELYAAAADSEGELIPFDGTSDSDS
ncbi:branched-chain amino acid aminotransferase [Marchantia polymorpha subsp. ruderalis]|uniref:Uncharacterized protein n=2 Tax=Marchantia polymorpha TaxID=3197 RepID=A0AAF6AYH7_MARPO|nr:hypothetical protein MARPO_0006s0260 [Marchantia polymorpha]BBN04811.1 hypothetical protein Mp_3g07830 [Marchantia polymorpha subsp. ruderalis]|eukprot:PTQ48262.1 hypothetical protein MARPO_0006s0260 [Marchantia polymorpha]